MKVSRKAIERVSGVSTFSLFAGLAALAALAVPSGVPSLVKLAAPGPAGAAPVPPREIAAVPPLETTSSVRVVRTQSITIPFASESETEQLPVAITVAARGERKSATSGEGAPETTWDGSPQRSTTPAAPAAPPAPNAKEPAPNKTSPQPAKAAPGIPVQPGAAQGAQPDAVPLVEEWTAEEVAGALKECLKLMGPVDAEIEPIEAMKKGPCGAPAPVRLKSIGGGKEKVEFTPPVEINCQLAVKLADWVAGSLQPAASEMLSSRVVRISGASGYQCRNRYGLANAPLSEHALANAVDIPGFVLADGRSVRVISSWGPTARDIMPKPSAASTPEIAAMPKPEPTVPGKAGKDRVESEPKKQRTAAVDVKAAKTADAGGKSTGKSTSDGTGVRPAADGALKGASRQQLGGVKPLAIPISASAAQEALKGQTPEARFLRRISAGACATFGTVLGPEANEAHRDHFHFDMKARKRAAYCQ